MYFIEAFSSVRGNSHTENQDSCFFKKEEGLIVFTVADGVGSLELSHLGSREVGPAVYTSFKSFIEYNNHSFIALISNIINLWNSKFEDSFHYSTTCLFTIVYNNTVYLAQLGDGILYYILNDELVVLSNDEKDFSNTTSSLSSALAYDFSYKQIELKPSDRLSILMATDGVSDTLFVDKRADFLNYILDNIRDKKDIKSRNDCLETLLREWKSEDDKTLGILYLEGDNIYA